MWSKHFGGVDLTDIFLAVQVRVSTVNVSFGNGNNADGKKNKQKN